MGGDREAGMEVIGQQSREKLLNREIWFIESDKYAWQYVRNTFLQMGKIQRAWEENKCWCMGGDREEGMDVIGQQSREKIWNWEIWFIESDKYK